jgi:hypothetical protein
MSFFTESSDASQRRQGECVKHSALPRQRNRQFQRLAARTVDTGAEDGPRNCEGYFVRPVASSSPSRSTRAHLLSAVRAALMLVTELEIWKFPVSLP